MLALCIDTVSQVWASCCVSGLGLADPGLMWIWSWCSVELLQLVQQQQQEVCGLCCSCGCCCATCSSAELLFVYLLFYHNKAVNIRRVSGGKSSRFPAAPAPSLCFVAASVCDLVKTEYFSGYRGIFPPLPVGLKFILIFTDISMFSALKPNQWEQSYYSHGLFRTWRWPFLMRKYQFL